jgi:phosphohistidine phosphatase
MKKTLLLLRHAKSSWENPACDDHERPLNERGRNAAKMIGRLIKQEKLQIDAVLSSTSVRTKETAALVFAQLKKPPAISYHDELYHASVNQIISMVKDVAEPARSVMVLGHNPGFEEFLTEMTGELQSFPTAGLARIEFELQRWSQLDSTVRGTLIELWRPKEMNVE